MKQNNNEIKEKKMGILAKLFGDCGKVRFEIVKENGEKGTGTMHIESFNNSKEEIEEVIKNAIFVDEGIRCKSIKIIGFSER